MAVESEIAIILPVGLSVAASAIFFAITRFSKTSEGTLTGTIEIKHVQSDMNGIRKDLREGFIRLESVINLKDDNNRETFEKIRQRLEDMEGETKLHTFRLELLEKQKERRERDATNHE